MKKILMGSVALTIFSISIIIFQMSCKKDATAQTGNYTLTPATTSTLGGVIVGNGLTVTSNGTISVNGAGGGQINKIVFTKLIDNPLPRHTEIWSADYDGTNQTKVNIIIPAGYSSDLMDFQQSVKISPNGQKLFFNLVKTATSITDIFSSNIDGSNVIKIIDGSGATSLSVHSAY